LIKNIAIIGAGFSAGTLNYFLKEEEVDFYEKSRGVGGRCSTRKIDYVGLFDHGLQYIQNPDHEFKNILDDHSIWQGDFKIFQNNKVQNDLDKKERIINVGGNNLLVKNLFKNNNIFLNKELKY
jgi:predicted NAD/FAD-dependent oxidoreductase